MSKIRRIGSFAKVRRGASPRPIWDPIYFGGDVGWVRIVDVTKYNYKYLRITEQYLSTIGQSKSVAVGKGDLIMSICATVGKPIIVDMSACIHDGFVQLYDLNGVDTEYLFYQLQFHEKDFEKRGQPGTQVNLNTKIVEDERIFVPEKIEKQRKIAAILSTVDQAIEKTEALIHKYQQIKAGLMHDLFTRGLTADGKLRPPREQAPELYQETPIGWIPKEWGYGVLNDVVNPLRPIAYGILMPGYGFDGGIPVVKVKDIQGGKIDTDNLLLTSPKIDNEYRRSRLNSGDILLTIRGSVGRVCIVPDELENANITQDTARIDLSEGSNEFYGYYFETDGATRHFSINTLGVAVQGINLGEVRKTPIPKPSRTEQSEIAKRVSGINNSIDREIENHKKLRLLKSGLMHDLLTGKVQVKIDQAETTHG